MQAMADLYRSASRELTVAAGLSVTEVDGSIVIAANRIDVLALNRVIGLGLAAPPSDGVLANIVRAFEEIGSPQFFVPLAPVEENEKLDLRLEQLGMRRHNNWMRLWRDLRDLEKLPPAPSNDRQIGPKEADIFGQLVANAFEYPAAIAPIAGPTVGRPSWHHYLAYDRDIPIAAAAMYLTHDAAWFGFAATAAPHRGRGAQRALVVRRLQDAAFAGCKWVSVETAEDTVTKEAPSFRNLRRLGFEVAYRRPNYLWTRSSVAR
jgi:hypothetical protein